MLIIIKSSKIHSMRRSFNLLKGLVLARLSERALSQVSCFLKNRNLYFKQSFSLGLITDLAESALDYILDINSRNKNK